MSEIKNYSIRINAGPDGSLNGCRAQIYLFGNDNTMDGMINFYEQGSEIPATKNELYIVLSMPASRLHDVVDMLRNESPVYLRWQESTKNAYLSTGQEPTGEGEGVN